MSKKKEAVVEECWWWQPMLNDATCFKNVYIVCGFTDFRKGIESLAAIIAKRSELKPFVSDTLYLFCGRRHNKIQKRSIGTWKEYKGR